MKHSIKKLDRFRYKNKVMVNKHIKRKMIMDFSKRVIAGLMSLAICFPAIPAGDTYAEGQDFSCCELLIEAPGPEFFTEDTEIVSCYNGIYLTRYSDAYATEEAYAYYSQISGLVEVNGSFRANGDEETGSQIEYIIGEEASSTDANMADCEDSVVIPETENGDFAGVFPEEENDESAGVFQINENEIDAFSYIDDIPVSDCSGCIALIDTGAGGSSVVRAISVLGGSVADDNGHGTTLANAISEANPSARILSIKALDSRSIGTVSDVYAAIEYAISSNAAVINLSMCSTAVADSELLRTAVNDAISRGIIVVASAGNNNRDAGCYTPANIGTVYTIGSADSEGNKTSTSNYGAVVDYYVVAESTSVAAARFSAYILDGIDSLSTRTDVFTREYVETEQDKKTELDKENEDKPEYEEIFDAEIKTDIDSNSEECETRPINSYVDDSEGGSDRKSSSQVISPDLQIVSKSVSEEGSSSESSYNKYSEDEKNSFYSVPSIKDEDGNALPHTSIMGLSTPSTSEFASEILLRGAITEESSWADCLNAIYGLSVTNQAVDSRPAGYPRWINATGMTINNGTGSGVSSNYTGAIADFGTLTAYDGNSMDSFALYGADDPSIVHTACYDHHIGIDKPVPPLGVQSIESINFEYAGYDANGWYYYAAVIKDWENTGHQRIFAYLCIKVKDISVDETYYYGFGVKKTDAETGDVIGGVTFDVYTSGWEIKIGSVTTSESDGIGVLRWTDVNYYGTDFMVMLKETDAPEGYKDNIGKIYGPYGVKGASVWPSPCTDGQFEIDAVGIEADVTNDHDLYFYGIGVDKKDEKSDKPLSGIKFDVYASNNLNSERLGSTITTDVNGTGYTSWTRKDNSAQEVYIYESYAPYPYSENIGKWYGPFDADGPSSTEKTNYRIYSIKNTPDYKGYVGVIKKDTISNKNIKGVVFDIYTEQKLSSTKLASITTGENGKGTASWSSVNKYTTVYAYEKSAPFPYDENVGKWYALAVSETENGITYKEAGNSTSYSLELIKGSSDAAITKDNPNYDLDGTIYEIYRSRDNSLCGSIEIDSDGHTKKSLDITRWMDPKDDGGYKDTSFYYKETAVGKNYSSVNLEKTGTFTVLATERIKSVNVTDIPSIDTVPITIIKKDATEAETDLSGVEFTINYYMLDAADDTEFTLEELLENEPTRSWVIETDSDNTAVLDNEHKVSGDDYYTDSETGAIGIPLGWLTIQETKEPSGYLINDEMSLVKIDSKAAAENKLHIISSNIMDEDGTGTVIEIPIRADVALDKLDYESGESMSDVEFEITNVTTGESHIIKTDENGNYDSSKVIHSSEGGLWFSKYLDGSEGTVNDDLGALPIGDYEIRELSTDSNQGYQLEGVKKFSVTEDDNGRIFKIYDADASESEEKIHNVKVPKLKTTANVVETDSHTIALNTPETIEDKVEYWYLESGESYTLLGRLMVKEADGTFHPYKKLEKQGDGTYKETDKELTSVLSFKTGTEYSRSRFEQCGVKTMVFENVMALEKDSGKTYVVFEYLYKGEYDDTTIKDAGEPYIKHEEDIYEQTIFVPKFSTTASDKADGDKEVEVDTDVTVTDKVVCEGLTQDSQYTLKGWLVNKKTGDKVYVNGKPVTSEKTFTATGEKTEVVLEFTFNTKGLADTEIVVFEECFNADGILMGWHKDLEDSGQTFKVKPADTPPVEESKKQEPETKTASVTPMTETTTEAAPVVEKNVVSNVTSVPRTGDDLAIQIFAAILLISGIASVYILYKKRKIHNDSDKD
ncbi:hypothetical protein SAMN02910369_00232 [Lachnospiraceae bacterium NE2001]|nr:hypothetical protein SAMN02910369_00232 [Lachnospiraceae bacterium NE2001]